MRDEHVVEAARAFAPDEVVLDRDRHTSRNRPGDSIGMASLFGVGIVGVNEDASSRLKM
jgi:hypothetical protein